MKRISKLIFSICCLVLSVTLSVAGIFAATQATLTISSSVSFSPTNIGMQIAGQMVNSAKTKGEYYFDRTFDGENYVNATEEEYSFKTWEFDAEFDPDKVLSDYLNSTKTSTITFYIQMKNFIDFEVELGMTMGQFRKTVEGKTTSISEYIKPSVTAYVLNKENGSEAWWNYNALETAMRDVANDGSYNGYSPELIESTASVIDGYKSSFSVAFRDFSGLSGENIMVPTEAKSTKYPEYTGENFELYDYTTNNSNNILIPRNGLCCLKIEFALDSATILDQTTVDDIKSNFMMIFDMQKYIP